MGANALKQLVFIIRLSILARGGVFEEGDDRVAIARITRARKG